MTIQQVRAAAKNMLEKCGVNWVKVQSTHTVEDFREGECDAGYYLIVEHTRPGTICGNASSWVGSGTPLECYEGFLTWLNREYPKNVRELAAV